MKITCSEFRTVADAGGNCPADTNNFPLLLQELRTAMGADFIITVASQAAQKNWEAMGIDKMYPYLDSFHVMTYDYTVSDIENSPVTAANSPLYNPKIGTQWSVDYTVKGYLAAGVPKEKIQIGFPYYGHTWCGLSVAFVLRSRAPRRPSPHAVIHATLGTRRGCRATTGSPSE